MAARRRDCGDEALQLPPSPLTTIDEDESRRKFPALPGPRLMLIALALLVVAVPSSLAGRAVLPATGVGLKVLVGLLGAVAAFGYAAGVTLLIGGALATMFGARDEGRDGACQRF